MVLWTKIDYNKDGVIDEYDIFVFRYVNGVEVDRRPLSIKVQKELSQLVKKSCLQNDVMQRVVYKRMPPQNMANPPPVVIKEETIFGQHIKAGAGDALGRVAVNGAANILSSLFSDE
jgi:hypothetical protein